MIYEHRIARFLNKNFEQILLLQKHWNESPLAVEFQTKLLKQWAENEGLQLDSISEDFELKFTLDEKTSAVLTLQEAEIKIDIKMKSSR